MRAGGLLKITNRELAGLSDGRDTGSRAGAGLKTLHRSELVIRWGRNAFPGARAMSGISGQALPPTDWSHGLNPGGLFLGPVAAAKSGQCSAICWGRLNWTGQL